jgi:hypothetical protein
MISSSCWYRFTYLSVHLPSWFCRIRYRSHRKTNRTARQRLSPFTCFLPTHAQDNVSELDKQNGKLKIMVEMDRKKEWQATAANERFGIMAGVPRWIGGEKQQVTWLVASAGSPPLRQAAGR